jgi:hypothetical protein
MIKLQLKINLNNCQIVVLVDYLQHADFIGYEESSEGHLLEIFPFLLEYYFISWHLYQSSLFYCVLSPIRIKKGVVAGVGSM